VTTLATRFELLAWSRRNLRTAQSQLRNARKQYPTMVPYWEASVIAWIDRTYNAQNNVAIHLAFVGE
jgi:hypothetical protein